MTIRFLADKDVTERELQELKSNRGPWRWLMQRHRDILEAAFRESAVNVVVLCHDGTWQHPSRQIWKNAPSGLVDNANATYRLHEWMEFPTPDGTRLSDRRMAFLWPSDGETIYCCPVWVSASRQLSFQRPNGAERRVLEAANYVDFLGCKEPDESGLPGKWIGYPYLRHNIAALLNGHHARRWRLRFVCFSAGGSPAT